MILDLVLGFGCCCGCCCFGCCVVALVVLRFGCLPCLGLLLFWFWLRVWCLIYACWYCVDFSLMVLFYAYVVVAICCIPFRRRLLKVLVRFGYLVLVVCLFGLGCAGIALLV